MIPADNHSVKTGPWQTIYWEKGPAAAQEYCQKKCVAIDIILDCLKCNSQTEEPIKYYEKKLERYQKFGRGELGRSPFNYPDFRHRFNRLEELNTYLVNKVSSHRMIVDSLISLGQDDLKHLLKTHQAAIKKWTERITQSNADPKPFLLPPSKDPYETMNIRWAHEQGYLGEGTSIIVVEEDADFEHPAIADAFSSDNVEKVKKTRRQIRLSIRDPREHGTHVCGIIAAKNFGAAPCAKIKLTGYECRVTDFPDIPIYNFSGYYHSEHMDDFSDGTVLINFISKLMQRDFRLAQQLMFMDKGPKKTQLLQTISEQRQREKNANTVVTDKLLFNSNGNDGVVISESPRKTFDYAYVLENPAVRNLCIRVVNMQQNGLYPCASANLPGDPHADITVCAVGTDVHSTLHDGKYGPLTGSSMASPFAASVALLIKGKMPHLTNQQIRSCILESATPIALDEHHEPHLIENPEDLKKYSLEQIALSRRFFGRGFLNAKGAIEMAKGYRK